jgi:TonB family protein
MKHRIAALLLLTAPALAGEVPPNSNGDFADTSCDYPKAALTAQAQGTTLLSFIGDRIGRVTEIKLVRSSGNADLDLAAASCIAGWRFDPHTALGRLQMGKHQIAIGWTITPSQAAGTRRPIPHTCEQDYPPEAMRDHASGTTTVAFKITDTGRVKEPTVVVSSGNADLDAASLTCVRNWRYRPAVKDGKPIEIDWKIEIRWAYDESNEAAPHTCIQFYPPEAVANHETGTARVRFFITTEGKVRDPQIETSSGSTRLDEAAIACVRNWRYRAALKDGKPVEIPWQADVRWALKDDDGPKKP